MELNKGKVIEISKINPTAEAVFKALAKRQRNRTQIDLVGLRQEMGHGGAKVVPNEFREVFKALNDAGIGRLVESKGNPIKFQWNFGVTEVAKTVLPQTGVPKPVSQEVREEVRLVIILGPGRKADIRLPANATPGELKSIANTVLQSP